MNLGQQVKLLRNIKQINQTIISRKLGISQQAYSKIEKRQYIDSICLQKILRALNSTQEELKNVNKFFDSSQKSN